MKTFLNKREWLNPIDSEDTGAISYCIKAASWQVESSFQIRDCGKQITLDFSCSSPKEFKRRQKKIKLLIASLQDIESSLPEAYEYYKANKED